MVHSHSHAQPLFHNRLSLDPLSSFATPRRHGLNLIGCALPVHIVYLHTCRLFRSALTLAISTPEPSVSCRRNQSLKKRQYNYIKNTQNLIVHSVDELIRSKTMSIIETVN
jgi:hypothetical protein